MQPHGYHYRITADGLVQALMAAFVLRLAGLRDIVRRFGPTLGTGNFSSLSHALARPASLRFVQALAGRLQARHDPGRDQLVVIDGMPLTLPATRRHRCFKVNDQTVGGGVIWSLAVRAAPGLCPVRVLKVMTGAWMDAAHMDAVRLAPHGPVYVMDRGFYRLELLDRWLGQGVRFVVRARRNIVYSVLRTLSRPRRYGPAGRIELDALVRLGCPTARVKAHPRVRLIWAVAGGQDLLVVTGETGWSAEQVLGAYKKRERIERFHRILKDVLGLAHLYSFSHEGMMFLLHVALLVAMLLVLRQEQARGEVVVLLARALREIRFQLGLGNVWRRNINACKRAKRWKNL